MGLDSVELLMEVEKAFGIQIPDEEAEKIYTVGDFYEVVWNKVQQKKDDACYTQLLFYNLRAALVELFGSDRLSIKTTSDLNELIPVENRRALFQQLSLQTELRLPSLSLIAPWSSIMYVASILFGIAPIIVVFIGWFFFSLPAQYFLVVLIGWVLLYSFSKLLNPFRQLVSPSNMRSFIEETLQLNHAALVNKNGISRANMETMIRMIIVDKIGVDMVEVIPSAKIHDDLGVD